MPCGEKIKKEREREKTRLETLPYCSLEFLSLSKSIKRLTRYGTTLIYISRPGNGVELPPERLASARLIFSVELLKLTCHAEAYD